MIDSQEIERVFHEIWGTALSAQGLRTVFEGADVLGQGTTMIACVSITGASNATLRIACPAGAANRIAQTMFLLPEEEIGEGEARDALGEIANMTAGNIKALLDGPSQLGLPVVSTGRDLVTLVPGTRPALEVSFRWDDDPVVVTLLVPQGPGSSH
jgi:CheY-specific phosphatase CheX